MADLWKPAGASARMSKRVDAVARKVGSTVPADETLEFVAECLLNPGPLETISLSTPGFWASLAMLLVMRSRCAVWISERHVAFVQRRKATLLDRMNVHLNEFHELSGAMVLKAGSTTYKLSFSGVWMPFARRLGEMLTRP